MIFQKYHGVGLHAEQQIAVFVHPVGNFREIMILVDQIQFRTAQIAVFELESNRQLAGKIVLFEITAEQDPGPVSGKSFPSVF